MDSLEERIHEALHIKKYHSENIDKEFTYEAHRLYALIQKHLSFYYMSYLPKVYQETNNLQRSLRIKRTNDGFEIYFEPSLAYHPSIMPTKYPKAFVPTLIDSGWDWGKNPRIHHFTYYEGYHFIEKAVEEFKQTTSLPITISIESKYHPEYYSTLG